MVNGAHPGATPHSWSQATYQWQGVRNIFLIAHFMLRKAAQDGRVSMRPNRADVRSLAKRQNSGCTLRQSECAGKWGEKPFPMSSGRGFVVWWELRKRESMLDAGIELDLGIHSAFAQRLPQ